MTNDIIYRYIGRGEWLPGIPTRDLTAADLAGVDIERLEASGLYLKIERPKTAGKGN